MPGSTNFRGRQGLGAMQGRLPVRLDAAACADHFVGIMTGHILSPPQGYMEIVLGEAAEAALREEVPVAALVVDPETREILALASNRTEELKDATAHAELLALQAAAKIFGGGRLFGCDLYVTLEPCPMCAAAISLARIRRLYFAAPDPKGGGVEHGPRIFDQPTCHHRPDVYGGIDEVRAGRILRDFFQARR